VSPTLLELARAGDQEAFERLVAPHLPRIHRFLASLCRRPGEAENLLMETACDAWRHLADLGDEPMGDWVLSRCASLAVRRLRPSEPGDRPRGPSCRRPLNTGPAGRWAEAPELDERVRRAIRSGVRRLPLLYRAVFLLCDVDHLSPEAAAAALHRSPEQVRRLRHEARLAMVEVIDAASRPGPERG
jgi:RNA polymerase sigma-70 factor (ECF subfamily)